MFNSADFNNSSGCEHGVNLVTVYSNEHPENKVDFLVVVFSL